VLILFQDNTLTAVTGGIQSYWGTVYSRSSFNRIILSFFVLDKIKFHDRLRYICNVSYHVKANRVINDSVTGAKSIHVVVSIECGH
jgi:hypothetical protein